MKFDFKKLQEINELDFEQIPIWPFEIKAVVALFVAIAVAAGTYFGLVSSKLPVLEAAQLKEEQKYTGY